MDSNDPTNLQKKIRNSLSPLNISLILLEGAFLIIVIAIFANTQKTTEVFSEINANSILSEVEGMTKNLSQDVATAVYDVVALNTNGNQSIDGSDLQVRKESLVHGSVENMDSSYYTFIVDIPKIQQSYRVYYDIPSEIPEDDLSGFAPEPMAFCLLDNDESIYPDFNCQDRYDKPVQYYIVNQYIESMYFDDFYTYIKENDPIKINIVSRYYDYTDSQSRGYIREVKSFIKSLGISPDLFEYYIVPPEELEIL